MDLVADEEEKRMDSRSISRLSPSSFFEIQLFCVRIIGCAANSTPLNLNLIHLRREIGVAMEINGKRISHGEKTFISLRRDRVDGGISEVTYVSTDRIRLSGSLDFEVRDGEELLLCGSLERMDMPWGNSILQNNPYPVATDKDPKTGWSMDCYSAASFASSIEVYVAGCCSGFPLMLTQTVQNSPRQKVVRPGTLDVIPEDDETNVKDQRSCCEQEIRRRLLSTVGERENEEVEMEAKAERGFYYEDEDGQLTWFNAGVRVGVGIGLGMCLGLGLGVGLLMHSYQATTRNFRRRFF